MKITVNLSKNELKALQELLYENPCRSGCVWEKCEEKANKIKSETRRYNYCFTGCEFGEAKRSLIEKFGNIEYHKNAKIEIKGENK